VAKYALGYILSACDILHKVYAYWCRPV